jgi:hypothetical protein
MRDIKTKIIVSDVIIMFSTILVITPWLMRNYVVFNKFVFISTNGGMNLLIGNNNKADGGYQSIRTIKSDLFVYEFSEVERDSVAMRTAIDYILKNPLKFVSLIPLKLKKLLNYVSGANSYFHSLEYKENMSIFEFYTLVIVSNMYYLVISVCSFYSMISLIINRSLIFNDRSKYLPFVPVIYFILLHGVVFFGAAKFNIMITPFMILIMGLFLLYNSKSTPSTSNAKY